MDVISLSLITPAFYCYESHDPYNNCGHERIYDVNRLCPLRANCPCFQFPMPMTRNLPVFAGMFSVSESWLHVIMPPLRLMGLIIVTVPFMKESLMKITCATSEKLWVRFTFIVLLVKAKEVEDSPVIVVISQMRTLISLVHQNITISLEHVSPLPLT